MVKGTGALLFGAVMSVMAFSIIGCTEQVDTQGDTPQTSGVSEEPAGGSGSAVPNDGSGSR